MMKLQFDLVIDQDGDAFYGTCPALKGVHVEGSSEQEVLELMTEAILAYLDSLKKHDDPLPVGCVVREVSAGSIFKGFFEKPTRHTRELLVAVPA